MGLVLEEVEITESTTILDVFLESMMSSQFLVRGMFDMIFIAL